MSEVCGAAYRSVRERVAGLVGALDPATWAIRVPATPLWNVHDLLAHLVGVSRDAVDGRLDGVSTEAWTAAQVHRRRDAPIDALLAEWDEYGPRFESRLTRLPDAAAGQAVVDAVSHEHDLRNAIGTPGAQASDAVVVAFDWLCGARTQGERPALRFRTDGQERTAGVGDPVATVAASPFELLRASTGRRTSDEIRTYQWDEPGDPGLILVGPLFSVRDVSLRER